MHDNPTPTIIERDAATDSAILGMLMLDTSHRPWSVEEIEREMGDDPTDSLRRLHGGGMIHRMGGFVWASHAAVYAEEIAA